MYDNEVKERFNRRVKKTKTCWLWTGGTFHLRGGYGKVQINKKARRTNRVAWELHHGKPVPEGTVVRHKCDNPLCVRPEHLELGTQGDNIRDRVARGREGDRSGSKNGRAKLTEDDVRAIRARAAQGETFTSISKDVPVCAAIVGKIVKRLLWPNLP